MMTGKGKISERDWCIRKILPGSRIKGLTRHPLFLDYQALKISVQKISEISMINLRYVNFPHSQFPTGIFINEFSQANFHYLRNENKTKKIVGNHIKTLGEKKNKIVSSLTLSVKRWVFMFARARQLSGRTSPIRI